VLLPVSKTFIVLVELFVVSVTLEGNTQKMLGVACAVLPSQHFSFLKSFGKPYLINYLINNDVISEYFSYLSSSELHGSSMYVT
jgi:hypothetical protein